MREGAPAGIRNFPVPRGVFPLNSQDATEFVADPEQLYTIHEKFENYAGVEDDPDVAKEIERLATAHYLKPMPSLEAVVKFLTEDPVVSKIGVITKVRNNVEKKRIVLDAKQSKISLSSRKVESVVLPRAMDLIWDILDLLLEAKALPEGFLENHNAAEIELFIMDFADAFWQIPLAPDERKFFTARL